MIKKVFTILTLLLCSDYLYSSVNDNTKLLKTDHFIIRYNIDEMQYAVYIAGVAETQFRQIEGFLDYSVKEDINLVISDDGGFSSGISINGNIAINTSSDQALEKTRLYHKLFSLFLKNLTRESHGFPALTFGDDPLDEVLCYYSMNGFDTEDELVLRDAFLRKYRGVVDILSVVKESRAMTDAVYSGFFSYLESEYGKNVTTRAVKEKFHYGNFFKALSAVTGKTISDIKSGFNNYLSGKYSADSASKSDEMSGTVNAVAAVDFLLSPDGGSILLLKNRNGEYRIEKSDLDSGETTENIKLTDNYTFNSISYADKNMIIVSGSSKDNSLVQVYSTDSFIKLNEYRLPLIFISKISTTYEKGTFIINSQYGFLSGILVADFNEKNISPLPSTTLLHVSDSTYFNGKIYYSIYNNLYETSVDNGAKVEPRPIVKLTENISSLTIEGDNIIISANSSSGGKVYLFNNKNGVFSEVFSLDKPIYKTIMNGSKLYCLVYQDGSRALLIKSLSR